MGFDAPSSYTYSISPNVKMFFSFVVVQISGLKSYYIAAMS